MTQETGESVGSTPVTIYGRTYHLRGDGDPDYLQELADLVDEKMREVAQATGTADTLKVAILAALNIADENLEGQRESEAPSRKKGSSDQRLAHLVTLLDDVLSE